MLFKYLSNEFEQISDDSNAGIPECLGKTSTGSKNANDNLVRNGACLQLPDLLPASTAVQEVMRPRHNSRLASYDEVIVRLVVKI